MADSTQPVPEKHAITRRAAILGTIAVVVMPHWPENKFELVSKPEVEKLGGLEDLLGWTDEQDRKFKAAFVDAMHKMLISRHLNEKLGRTFMPVEA
jgi:hypothetical protein